MKDRMEKIIDRINEVEREANSVWFKLQTVGGKNTEYRLERRLEELDKEAGTIIRTVIDMGYDIERDGIGNVISIK